jgi:phytoene synthase
VSAEAGIALLPPWSARSIAGAHILYGQILDRIEANDYDVFVRRARVPTARKLSTAARLFARRP